jgi:hypothetical protein
MLERLAPKLVDKFRDTELLEHIGKPLHRKSLPFFDEFRYKVLDERENFHGNANEYIELLVTHLNRTCEKFVSLGGFTRSQEIIEDEYGMFTAPKYFSHIDEIVLCGVIKKLTDPEMFVLLLRLFPSGGEPGFSEVRSNALIELQGFKRTASAYFTFQLMQLNIALAEVIAFHKFGPK